MTESMKYYESIRRKYPEAVSKDQFYQIAHISKATALHLLQNGLVPCKDTGKKTRRYTIRTDDIIFYLIDRELHPGGLPRTRSLVSGTVWSLQFACHLSE